MFKHGDVARRVAPDRDHIAISTDRDRSDVAAVQSLGGAAGRGLDRLQRSHAPLHHLGELTAILPVRIDSGVGAEDHLHARADRPLEGLALLAADHPFLVETLLLRTVRSAGREDVVVIVDVHVEPRAVLFGELDRGVAGEARVLDGVDSGEDRIVDPGVAVGMGGDLEPEHVRLVGDRLHLLEAELLRADAVAHREHAAGRADLDHFGAVFVHPAHLLARIFGSADDRRRLLVVIRRQSGVVAMSAGRSDGIGRRDDPWPGHQAGVDRLLQPDVVEVARSDVAHRGEAGVERFPRIADAGRFPEAVGIFETLIAADFGHAGQVHVHIDEPGQQSLARQIDMLRARGHLQRTVGADLRDLAIITDQDRGLVDIAASRHVEHPVGGDDGCGGGGAGDEQRSRADEQILDHGCFVAAV